MKHFKSLVLIISMLIMVFVVSGCSKENDDKRVYNFSINYESNKEVDKIVYTIDGKEGELKPMHDDKKLKKGYGYDGDTTAKKDIIFSIKIINEGKTIYEIDNKKVDLSEDKYVEVNITDAKNNSFDIKVVNQ